MRFVFSAEMLESCMLKTQILTVHRVVRKKKIDKIGSGTLFVAKKL